MRMDDPPLKSIGEKIRQYRKEKRLTVEALASQCQLSAGLISQVERGLATPSLDSLWRITRALDIPLIALFDAEDEERVTVLRADQQKRLVLPESNVTYRMLSPGKRDDKIEFLSIILEPGTWTDGTLLVHQGEECGVVVQGEITVMIGDREYLLREGDSIYFDSTLPHRFFNRGKKVAVGIWAMTPPSF